MFPLETDIFSIVKHFGSLMKSLGRFFPRKCTDLRFLLSIFRGFRHPSTTIEFCPSTESQLNPWTVVANVSRS